MLSSYNFLKLIKFKKQTKTHAATWQKKLKADLFLINSDESVISQLIDEN